MLTTMVFMCGGVKGIFELFVPVLLLVAIYLLSQCIGPISVWLIVCGAAVFQDVLNVATCCTEMGV